MPAKLEEYRLCSNKSAANKIPVGSNSPKSVEHNGIYLDIIEDKTFSKERATFISIVQYYGILFTWNIWRRTSDVTQMCKSLKGVISKENTKQW